MQGGVVFAPVGVSSLACTKPLAALGEGSSSSSTLFSYFANMRSTRRREVRVHGRVSFVLRLTKESVCNRVFSSSTCFPFGIPPFCSPAPKRFKWISKVSPSTVSIFMTLIGELCDSGNGHSGEGSLLDVSAVSCSFSLSASSLSFVVG